MTHGSTFSGIGAPEIAAEMLGWTNVFHCEINPFGRTILDYYYPNAKSYEDITKTDFSEWRGRVDVLTGGFPCQPFSYAGKRRGSEDDRYLWPYMLKCIEQVQPTWFIGENVAGITTMVFPGDDVKVGNTADLFGEGDDIIKTRVRYVLDEICENLEGVGYEVQPFIVPACAVGAPHRRDRVFIIAHRKGNFLENAVRGRCVDRQNEEQRNERNERNFRSGNNERVRRETGHIADTDTDSEHLGTGDNSRTEGERRKKGFEPLCCKIEGERVEFAWGKFPKSEPSIRRGNDGLPFDVDDLTISFAEWRKESIKAYGNAIVPQVMYEIFKAIEEVEKQSTIVEPKK